jgi:Pyruvate/2-oxoacid:ferredoxin oxidoreductase delta subunit
MPAFADEIQQALEEKIRIVELRSPLAVQTDGSKYTLVVQKMAAIQKDGESRASVIPLEGQVEALTVSHVFKAIGGLPEYDWYKSDKVTGSSLPLAFSKLIVSDGQSVLGYGGDLTSSGKSVAHAIASAKETVLALDILFQEGKEAVGNRLQESVVGKSRSLSMEIYLKGPRHRRDKEVVAFDRVNTDYFSSEPRNVRPYLAVEKRLDSFLEVERGLSLEELIHEAQRCFNCGICNQCDTCSVFCPDLAVHYDPVDCRRQIDYDYCKGCGICVFECPRNAMTLEEKTYEESA